MSRETLLYHMKRVNTYNKIQYIKLMQLSPPNERNHFVNHVFLGLT